MLDLGMGELLIIGIVALIVVGPKDLPNMFRAVGRFTGKARGMAREFSRAMEAAADEAGVKDIDRTIRAATNPVKYTANSLREAAGLNTPAQPVAPAPVVSQAPPAAGTTAAAPASATAELAARRTEEQARAAGKAADLAARRTAPAPAAEGPQKTEEDPRP